MYHALILRSDPFRESDRTITMFTREAGLVRLIARGSQKILSKNATALEPSTFSIVGVAVGKELSYVTSAQAEEYFSPIRTDLLKSVAVLYICHLLARVMKESDPHPEFWEDVVRWLHALQTDTPFQIRMIDALILRLLAALGFAPTVDGEGIAFSIADGCLVDRDRARELLLAKEPVIRVDPDVMQLMNHWLSEDWIDIQAAAITDTTASTVHRLVYAYAQYHLERELADWERMVYSFE